MNNDFFIENKTKIIIGIVILVIMAIVLIFFMNKKEVEKIEFFAIEVDLNTIGMSKVEYGENYETVIYTKKNTFFMLKTLTENIEGENKYGSTNGDIAVVSSDGAVNSISEGTAYIYSVLDDKTSNYIKVVVE